MEDLQYLLDAHRIGQCLLKYPVALDSRDFDLLESLFTPDARIDIDPKARAEELDVGAFCRIANAIAPGARRGR